MVGGRVCVFECTMYFSMKVGPGWVGCMLVVARSDGGRRHFPCDRTSLWYF